MKVYKALIVFCVAGSFVSPLKAKAGETTIKLSLSDAITMARQNNSSIKASRSRIDQAEARVVQTRQVSLPKVTLSETFMVTNDPGAALVFKLQQKSLLNSDFDVFGDGDHVPGRGDQSGRIFPLSHESPRPVLRDLPAGDRRGGSLAGVGSGCAALPPSSNAECG